MNADKMKAGARRKFDAGLQELSATPTGFRHRKLFGLARLGTWAGLTPDEIESALFTAGRYTEGERREIRETIAKVRADSGDPTTFSTARPHHTAQKASQTPSAAEQGLFRECIRLGGGNATFGDLSALSPGYLPKNPFVQAISHLRALFDEADIVWCGSLTDARNPSAVRSREDWCDLIQKTESVPPFLAANPVTGACVNGGYRNSATIADFRHAVIEIDTLPLNAQCAFWIGVLKQNLLPVRTLVYSGGKSIHGILRLTDGQENWKPQWDTLARCFASDPDPTYRIDLQCRDATRMTRLAGALRPETGQRQNLLWAAS